MKLFQYASVVVLPIALSSLAAAQDNQQDVKDAHHQAKLDEKADKSQAKADKADRKALKSHKVKKAAKKQDEADRAANKADMPPK